jgi:hypothetical protein
VICGVRNMLFRSRIELCRDSTKSRVNKTFWKIRNPSSHHSLWWVQRALGAAGSGCPSSRAAMAATFWLTRAKSGGPSTSSRILQLTLQALARAR